MVRKGRWLPANLTNARLPFTFVKEVMNIVGRVGV
jgi:hypothetical protein